MILRGYTDVLARLGERVRGARVAAGLTQEAAAEAAEIDPRRWQRIEEGSVNVTVKTLVRVALAVRTDFWALVGDNPNSGGGASARARKSPHKNS